MNSSSREFMSQEIFVANATSLKFLKRFRCNCCLNFEEGVVVNATVLEFLRKVSLQLLRVVNL